MIPPEVLSVSLEQNLHPESIKFAETGEKGVKKFSYFLEVAEYRTFAFLKKQVSSVEEDEDVELHIEGVKPTIHQTDSAIEARIRIEIEENFNRYEVENKSLNDYE